MNLFEHNLVNGKSEKIDNAYLNSLFDMFMSLESYSRIIVDSMNSGVVSIPEIHGQGKAHCLGCLYFSGNLCLCFEVGGEECWVFQSNSTLVYFYNRSLGCVYSALSKIKKHFFLNFDSYLSEIGFAKSDSPLAFKGVLFGYSRPYHFYADHLSGLYEISRNYLSCRELKGVKFFLLDGGVFFHPNDFVGLDLDYEYFDEGDVGRFSNGCFLRLARGKNQSYDNYNMGKVLTESVLGDVKLLASSCQTLSIVSGFDHVIWFGACSEKRDWHESTVFLKKVVDYFLGKGESVFVFIDGLTGMSRPGSYSLPLKTAAPLGVDVGGSEACCFYSVDGLSSKEKILFGSYSDFCITNFASDSLHTSRILKKKGIGFGSSSFLKNGLKAHRHVGYFLIPPVWVEDDITEESYDRVSFSIDPGRVLEFFLSIYKKNTVNPLPALEGLSVISSNNTFVTYFYRLLSPGTISLRNNQVVVVSGEARDEGKGISMISFKGESEHGVRAIAVIELADTLGRRSEVKVWLGGSLFDFPDVDKVVSVKLSVFGPGRFDYAGVHIAWYDGTVSYF